MFTETSTTQDWPSEKVIIIGGGSSASSVDFNRINGLKIGVNDSAFHTPCDILFSMDGPWIKNRRHEIQQFPGERWLAVPPNYTDFIPGVNYLKLASWQGKMSDSPDTITCGNSGYGAMNLAYLKQSKVIILIGFDMNLSPAHYHWHNGYCWFDGHLANGDYIRWVKQAEIIAAQCFLRDMLVVNCNLKSAIRNFVFVEPESLYEDQQDFKRSRNKKVSHNQSRG
jgi:hypothetical protein